MAACWCGLISGRFCFFGLLFGECLTAFFIKRCIKGCLGERGSAEKYVVTVPQSRC